MRVIASGETGTNVPWVFVEADVPLPLAGIRVFLLGLTRHGLDMLDNADCKQLGSEMMLLVEDLCRTECASIRPQPVQQFRHNRANGLGGKRGYEPNAPGCAAVFSRVIFIAY